MFTSRRTAATATAAALLILLSGCGGSSGSDATAPKVASVPDASGDTTPSAEGSDSGKETTPSSSVVDPQLRLDSTQADVDRAYEAYYACWEEKGVPKTAAYGQKASVLMSYKLHSKKYQAAVDACADAEPRTPRELDPDKNPKYWDQLREQVRCVQAQGLRMKIIQGTPGLFVGGKGERRDFDKVSSPRGQKIVHECEVKAFAGK
jgi:hypothetical protein